MKHAHAQVAAPARASAAAAVAVVVSAALLGAGAAQVHLDRATRAHQKAVAAAVAHEDANRVRSHGADGARLEGRAVGYAAIKRGEALAVARAAVAQATTVAAVAVADVAPEALTPLGEATAALSALIAAAPTPIATPSPVEPVAPVGSPVAGPATAASAVSAPAADRKPTGDPSAAPSSVASELHRAPDGAVADLASAAVLVEPTVALDLVASARILAAAQVVSALSEQVQATAVANAAAAVAAGAAAQAKAAAAAAGRRGAAESARKVAAADDSPNGDIAADVLCGVSFAPKVLLRCDAAPALERLDAAFRAEFDADLIVASTYRSFADQVVVKELRGDLAATPGTSNHGRGLAIDFSGVGSVGQFSDPTYLWLKGNAGEFGWKHPAIMEPGGGGPQEPWHWEFGTD